MAVFNEPTQWTHTLGNNADVSTLPDDTSANSGVASLQKLFQLINQTPLEAGGVAPDREDFNALYKILGDYIFFLQNGGVPAYNATYDYVIGRMVLYTDGNIYKCIQANGASSTVVAPDSVSPVGSDYWKRIDEPSAALIPNQLVISPAPLTDANLHLLDGALLSGSGTYSAYVAMMSDLYNADPTATCWTDEATWQASVTTYGECGKFVVDTVNNTVRLPKLTSFVQATSTASELGLLVEAGAPNITGSAEPLRYGFPNSQQASGAMSVDVISNGTIGGEISGNTLRLSFDASQSNSIYGNSNTIQPQAIKYYFYIVVGTVSKTDIQIDIDNVLTDLNGKADKDLLNVALTSAFATAMNSANIRTVIETYSNNYSWYRVWSDGFCEQGGCILEDGVSQARQVTFAKPFGNTYYTVSGIYCRTQGAVGTGDVGAIGTPTITATGFEIYQYADQRTYWTACGYIS